MLLIGLLVLSVVVITEPIFRKSMLTGLACVLLLAAALVAAVGQPAAGKIVWIVPRVMAPIAAFAAALIMICWRHVSWPLRIAVGFALVLLCVSYVGSSNRIIFDQHRVNLWDLHEANRIVERLELQPRFGEMQSIALMGGNWGRPSALQTTYGDLNISALSVEWAKVGLIQEATGYRFKTVNSDERVKAEEYCHTTAPWPAAAAVTIIERTGVVCLGKK